MKYFTFLLTFLSMNLWSYGQNSKKSYIEQQSFSSLTDSVIISEISSFSIIGCTQTKQKKYPPIILKEIPLKFCTKNEIYFSSGSTYICLFPSKFESSGHKLLFDGQDGKTLNKIDDRPFWGTTDIPKRKMDSFSVVLHEHFLIQFPDSAFYGIYEPNFCEFNDSSRRKRDKKRYGHFISPYYKIYKSKSRHIYIYMLGGEGINTYEVIWIMENERYLTRIVDYVFR